MNKIITLLFVFLLFVPASLAVGGGIRGYWTFNDTLTDLTGNASLTWDDTGTINLVNGVIGQARQADTVTDYASIPFATFDTNAWTEYTYAMMYYFDNAEINDNMLSRDTAGFKVNYLKFHDGNKIRFAQGTGGATISADVATTNSKWYCVVASAKEGSNITLYVNGTTSSTAFPGTFATVDEDLTILDQTGNIDELLIADEAWSYTEAENYCDNIGNGTFYPFTPTPTPTGTTYAIISLKDLYDNSSLPDGTTCYMGSVSNTSVGGVCSFYNQTTGLNYSVGSADYFTTTGTVTENTTTNVYLYGAFPTLTAYDVEGDAINTFNVTTGVQSNQTTTGSLKLLFPPDDTTAVNVTAPYFFLYSDNLTTTGKDTGNYNFSGLYQSVLTINATNAYTGNPLLNFTGWAYHNETGHNVSFSDTGTGTATLNVLFGNYTIYIDAYEYSISENNTAYIGIDTPAETQTFNLLSENSIYLTIFDEEDSTLITQNITIILSGNTSETTYYTTTGHFFFENLTDGAWSLKLSGTNYTLRTYDVNVADRSSQVLNVFLSRATDLVTFNVIDFDSAQSVVGASAIQQRLINGTWTTIASRLTDITGRAQFTYTIGVNYRFSFTKTGYEDEIFSLNPIIFTSYDIRLQQTQVVDEDLGLFDVNIVYFPKIFYNNQNNSFTFSVTSPGGSLETYGYCLAYPGGTICDTGVDSQGEMFLTGNYFITNATFFDRVNLSYWYESVFSTENTTFFVQFLIDGSANTGTIFKEKDNTFGLSAFERYFIAIIVTILIAGMLTLFGNPIMGGLGIMVGLGFFVFTGFISIWSVMPGLLLLFLILLRKSDT